MAHGSGSETGIEGGLYFSNIPDSNTTSLGMYAIGKEICQENQLDFDILKPLITETANKVQLLSPEAAQTGPAKRNDTTTINAHLTFLKDHNQKEIYKLLTKSIIDHEKKL